MAAALEVPPMASTFSRPLVYKHYLVNKYDQEEQEVGNIEECKTTVPILDHRYDYYDQVVPRLLIPLFNDDGPWEIKKILKKSDVGALCRLHLSHDIVERYIFSYWDVRRVQGLKSDDGYFVKVLVRDFDTCRVHKLAFRKWKSNSSYVFQTGWSSKFVKAMSLEAGDEIGMFWNSKSNFFVFKLLKKHV